MSDESTTPTEHAPQNNLEEAPESVQELPRGRKISKMEMKRQAIFLDRVKRHMANGMTFEQAQLAVRREDYEKLPVEKKLQRIEGIVASNVQGLRNDIVVLRDNQSNVADAMDANFRAFAKMMEKLGLPKDQQEAIFAEALQEMEAEVAAKQAARAVAKQQAEEKAIEEAVSAPASEDEPTPVPEEATVFGG